MNNHRKLLVLGLNEMLKAGRFSFDPAIVPPDGHLEVEIGEQPSIVIWRDIGSRETQLSVWWKYDHSKHPQAEYEGNMRERFNGPEPLAKPQHYPKFVGAFACGWLDRRNPAHLEGYGSESIFETYTRRGEAKALQAIPTPVPLGFVVEGSNC